MKHTPDHELRGTGVRPGRRQVVTKGKQPTSESEPLLPHERDETSDPTDVQTGSKDIIKQAGRDVKRGLRDTDLRHAPDNVPGPGVDPEQTPGADVPAEEAHKPHRKDQLAGGSR